MTHSKIIAAASVFLIVVGGLWYAFSSSKTQDTPAPVVREEKAEPPNLPKPPSFIERVMKDNPHLDRKTAEQYEQERIAINVAHQEERMRVLAKAGSPDPEELIQIELKLARELGEAFAVIDKKYSVVMKQNPPTFLGAPVPPPL